LESYKKAKEQLEKEAKEKKPEPVVAVKKPVVKKDKSKEAAEIASSIAPPAKDQ
jgi:hypothetical protein